MNPFTQPLLKQAVIKKEDGRYKLYTRDGKRVLGVHDTRQEAIKQEYAIEKSQEKRATIDGENDLSLKPIQRFDHGPDQPALPATSFQTIKAQPVSQQDRQALFQPEIKTPRPNEMRPVQTTGDRFTEATNRLFQREGYGEPVTDSGGYTRWGISQDAWPDEDIKNMTRERATEIYREHYWPKKLNEFPAIQEKMFDLRVNAGPRTNKWLQQSLLDAGGDIGEHGVDGHIGGDTLSALREADRGTIMELLINKQREEYERLRKADPEKYGDTAGWDERLKFNPLEFYQ